MQGLAREKVLESFVSVGSLHQGDSVPAGLHGSTVPGSGVLRCSFEKPDISLCSHSRKHAEADI